MPILQDTPSAKFVGRFQLAKDDLIILDRQAHLWKHQHTDTNWNMYTEPGISTLDSWVHTVP